MDPRLVVGRRSHDLLPSDRILNASDVSSSLVEAFRLSITEAESYLSLYEARVKLEEDYTRGLRSLVEKQRENDVRIESRINVTAGALPGTSDLPGARRAWRELRENDLREIDVRLSHIETLKQGVIVPLHHYRDSQERIRKRVKEDLKTSCGRYEEMRNVTLPRAKRSYEKKSEEVEQIRLQQQAVEDQKMLLASSGMSRDFSASSTQPGSEGYEDLAYGSSPPTSDGSGAAMRSSPRRTKSTKDKARGHARLPSSGSGAVSDREEHLSSTEEAAIRAAAGAGGVGFSPPSNTGKPNFLDALRTKEGWEAARKEAPKKFGAFISRMREGAERGVGGSPEIGSPAGGAEGLGGASGTIKSAQNMALKNVKAKREAEEADKIYRKAIFDLETLRLRREKTVAAATRSAIECRKELYNTSQIVWLQSERAGLTLHSTAVNLHHLAEDIVAHANDHLDQEITRFEQRLPGLDLLDEGPIAYHNYFHGECKDLIFGTSLIDYAFSRAQHSAPVLGPARVEPPLVVTKCIDFVEAHALEQPGIYRTSAKHTTVQNLAHAVEKDEERFQFGPDTEPSAVAGLLKLYLRQLPEPVMPMPWEERVRHTHERQQAVGNGFASLKGRIRRLPPINQAVLKAITLHLAKVADRSDVNKMNASNLSVVFGPVLLSEADHETTSLAAAMEEDRVMEDMIIWSKEIFDLTTAGAPLLPHVPITTGLPLDVPENNPLATEVEPVSSSADAPLVLGSSAGLKRSNAITPNALSPTLPSHQQTAVPLSPPINDAASSAEPGSLGFDRPPLPPRPSDLLSASGLSEHDRSASLPMKPAAARGEAQAELQPHPSHAALAPLNTSLHPRAATTPGAGGEEWTVSDASAEAHGADGSEEHVANASPMNVNLDVTPGEVEKARTPRGWSREADSISVPDEVPAPPPRGADGQPLLGRRRDHPEGASYSGQSGTTNDESLLTPQSALPSGRVSSDGPASAISSSAASAGHALS
ncbi:RhoGAP-domain-containing protein [Ceraceosorus guamensis]|uniref:RhoGAP-domain-containing protein n=1 Tax=Ceraceosorus guamensis TaxID=1522189 RepID=A0A316W501_9BASI|nr:RhoGAP-domain-containing protein [Ceraceosorus guamensis]PWN44996.1 RhoGAP-domain-containing protein [Ceraceosorus guamensis]